MKLSLEKIKTLGFYLLMFLLPWQTRLILKAGNLNNSYWEYGSFSLYLTDILLLVLIILAVIGSFKFSKFKNLRLYWYFLAGLEVMIIISIFIATAWPIALYHYAWFILFAGLIWLISSGRYSKEKLFTWFLAGTVLQAVLAIAQFFAQQTWAFKYLGLASHNSETLGVAVIETVSGRWLRAYGGLDHPNILGALMAIGVVMATYLLLKQADSVFDKIRLKKSLLLWAVLLLNFLALFFSFSRMAWVAGFIGVMIVLIKKLSNKKYFSQASKIILSLVLFSFILANSFGALVSTRFDFSNRLEQKSFTEREAQIYEAKDVINNNFWLGVGLGNYSLALSEVYPDEPAYRYQPTHNSLLLIWAEVGIIGLIFFVLFLVYLIGIAIQQKDSLKLAIWVMLVLILMSEHWLVSLHFGWLIMALLSGIILRRKN